MSAVVISLPRAFRVVVVQPCERGFTVTFRASDGARVHLGTRQRLGEARSLAHSEAFKMGRCRVQFVGTGASV